jgi:hypothetical protein
MELFDFLAGRRPNRKRSRAYINYQGYIMMWNPTHPRAWNTGYVLAHYLLWERYHNACLLKCSKVYHKDGNKLNNHNENLIAIYFMKSSIPT